MTAGFPDEMDRWRAAQQLMDAHGELAEYQAGVRAGDMLKNGSQDGYDLWQDIAVKVRQLQSGSPGDGQLN